MKLPVEVLRPVPLKFKVSSPFGKTRLIDGKMSPPHKGIDFACPVGTPIRAAWEGVAVRTGWENPQDCKQGYGLRVMQRVEIGGHTYFFWYGHGSKVLVEEGDKILKGQIIMLSGNTGKSTGPHMHFGVRRSDTSDFYDADFYSDEGKDNVA